MSEQKTAKSASDTLFTPKRNEVLSCKTSVHPQFGTEYSCQWPNGPVYMDKKLPPEKVFDQDFHIEQDGVMIGKKNRNGDLLVSPELTNDRPLIILNRELWTDIPPKGSTVTKIVPEGDTKIIMTPQWVWNRQDRRELNYNEVMELIIKKLQNLDKRRSKEIGPRASIDDNFSILQERTETA